MVFRQNLQTQHGKNQIRKMLLENDFIGFGIILRTNAGSAGPEQILEECEKLKAMLKQLIKRAAAAPATAVCIRHFLLILQVSGILMPEDWRRSLQTVRIYMGS